MNEKPMFLIWSHEHHMWWAPNREGYTLDTSKAGRYTFEEAADITIDHFPAGEEVAIRESVALSHGLFAIHGASLK